MKIKCVGIGKTVGAYGLEQVQTYVQRIQRFMSFEWVELKEVKHNKNNSFEWVIIFREWILQLSEFG